MGTTENKKKLKKIIKIFIIILVATGILWLVFFAVEKLFLNDNNSNSTEGNYFFPVDYNENIFNDPVYLSKDREVYYLEYDTGEKITSQNIDTLSDSAKFFNSYFSIVINGEYDRYKSLFTEDFFKSYTIPERFTMQKVYDIKVNLYNKQVITQNDIVTTVETYIVGYKILNNNGTFRSDVGSNSILPLVFELYRTDNSILINKIYNKQNIKE